MQLGSLLVVEWGFGGVVGEAVEGHRTAGVDSGLAVPGTGMGITSQPAGMTATPAVDRIRPDARSPGASVTINDGSASTSTRRVTLSLLADDPLPGSDVVEMRIRNGGGESWTEWRTYATRVDWKLSEGQGEKAVYV